MKIIDRDTGKRVIEPLKKGKVRERITKDVEKDLEVEEHSPMDPPDAYDLTYALNDVKVSDMSNYLQQLVKEHEKALEQIELFEKCMVAFKENKYVLTQELSEEISAFFEFFDNNILDHNRREEKHLFPLLHKGLLESGEHSSRQENPQTAVDLMEDDHVSFIQSATLVFNLLGLTTRVPDPASRAIISDLAYHSAVELIEGLKLHIFKEDHTLFPLAHKLIRREQFEEMEKST